MTHPEVDVPDAELPARPRKSEQTKARIVDAALALFLEHGLGLSPGADFGAKQFVRLNFGTQRKVLASAMERFGKAVAAARK